MSRPAAGETFTTLRPAVPGGGRIRRALVAVIALVALVSGAAPAAGSSPSDVYQDFIDGRLDRTYDPDLLRRVISDATINQYGDPLLTQRLRRAARQQLAGVVPSSPSTATPPGSPPAVATPPGSTPPASTSPGSPPSATSPPPVGPSPPGDPSAPGDEPSATAPAGPDGSPAAPGASPEPGEERAGPSTAPTRPGAAPPSVSLPGSGRAAIAAQPLFSTSEIAVAISLFALLAGALAWAVAQVRRRG